MIRKAFICTIIAGTFGLFTGMFFFGLIAIVKASGHEWSLAWLGKVWVFLNWPVLQLAELDRHREGRFLYENPKNFFFALGIYWSLLGVMGYWGFEGVRQVIRKIKERKKKNRVTRVK